MNSVFLVCDSRQFVPRSGQRECYREALKALLDRIADRLIDGPSNQLGPNDETDFVDHDFPYTVRITEYKSGPYSKLIAEVSADGRWEWAEHKDVERNSNGEASCCSYESM